MSALVVIGLVVGFVAVVAAVQAAARQLQLFPVNPGSVGSLIGTDRQRTFTTTAFELEELRAIVSDSLASQGVANAKLWPLIAEMKAAAPAPKDASTSLRSASKGVRIGEKRHRADRLETALSELEAAWGITEVS